MIQVSEVINEAPGQSAELDKPVSLSVCQLFPFVIRVLSLAPFAIITNSKYRLAVQRPSGLRRIRRRPAVILQCRGRRCFPRGRHVGPISERRRSSTSRVDCPLMVFSRGCCFFVVVGERIGDAANLETVILLGQLLQCISR